MTTTRGTPYEMPTKAQKRGKARGGLPRVGESPWPGQHGRDTAMKLKVWPFPLALALLVMGGLLLWRALVAL